MRNLPAVACLMGSIALFACSDNSSLDEDLLGGANESTIEQLCGVVFHVPDATRVAQAKGASDPPDFEESQSPDVMLASLSETASKQGAKNFAEAAADAAEKAEVLLDADIQDFGEFSSRLYRFELADTRLRLSCTLHGHHLFNS